MKRRFVVWADFDFHAASREFHLFNEVTRAQFGVTSNQATPEYSNIENGLGLLASRYTKEIREMKFSPQAIDEIACGDITGHLSFAPNPLHPDYPFCQ